MVLLIVNRQRKLDSSPCGVAKARREPLLRQLGARMKHLRESREWTQETLAARAGLDRSYVAGIEAGLRNPSTKALAKLADALSLSLSDLLKGVG